MKLQNWTARPVVAANLINPAFCCEIIKECMKSYKTETTKNFPYAYSALILPFILPSKFRSRFPKTKATTLHAWLNENENLKIGLAEHIRGFVEFTKEAVMFGIVYNSIRIDENGDLEPLGKKGKSNMNNDETNDCLSKASLWGKMLSKAGDHYTVYSMLGIKP